MDCTLGDHKTMKIEQIASITHEANRAYCRAIGDDSQPAWDDAPAWQRDSAMNGVRYHLSNPNARPQDSHESWLAEKYRDGWKWGPEKNPATKEHPCCVPFDKLPPEQQAKDHLFMGVVRALERFWDGIA